MVHVSTRNIDDAFEEFAWLARSLSLCLCTCLNNCIATGASAQIFYVRGLQSFPFVQHSSVRVLAKVVFQDILLLQAFVPKIQDWWLVYCPTAPVQDGVDICDGCRA